MSSHIVEEAKRCLQCKVPKCREGCPVQTPVNEFIRAFLEEDILSAGAMLFENNPLSVVCSLVCPQEFQCEGHCVLGKKAGPVHISDIEHYISSYYLSHIEGRRLAGNGHKVAIIGSGPAGITVAFLLAQRGFEITIYEAHDLIGGVMRYGIPGFRLPKDLLEKLKDKLVDMGVKIRPNTLIGPTLTLDDLFRDGFKAVFIGTGVWKPRKLDVKGESLGHVHYAIDYLKNPEVYTLGRRVIVIGAGNTAMDVARTALRKSLCRVTVVHIGDPGTMSALPEELEMAKMDGVKFIYNRSTVEILDEGIKVRRTQRGGPGGPKWMILEGTEEILEADTVIIAISQGPRDAIVSTTQGIERNPQGLVSTDECGRTTRQGVFASGDVVHGARTVVQAVKVSKQVAKAIEEYVLGL
ncbi:NAD(P)-dependent oxidoreductase [Holophaga foetida]|uniref:NAD(P)-dependent oxidoreductase n=1 Tax=Holophaga foetida TaxID=35839 RepID=UPI000247218C|nr:NAD(P)-dependent oxidoreductase [Holophaga foetida]